MPPLAEQLPPLPSRGQYEGEGSRGAGHLFCVRGTDISCCSPDQRWRCRQPCAGRWDTQSVPASACRLLDTSACSRSEREKDLASSTRPDANA
eukprot:scaffold273_cov242-Pinguiococcus_pyrenoidosus.AAC.41